MKLNNNRWWENYLVRYFGPSIAGMVLVGIIANELPGVQCFLLNILGINKDGFNTAKLLLWLMMGTLYCYVASYPILSFHASRVLDFNSTRKKLDQNTNTGLTTEYELLNPYFWTVIYTVAIYILYFYTNAKGYFFEFALFFTSIFACIQVIRIHLAYSSLGRLNPSRNYKGTAAYSYLFRLARKRAQDIEETTEEDIEENPDNPNPSPDENAVSAVRSKIITKTTDRSTPYSDIVESYKHLREHGNTAFIIFLEVALFPIAWWAKEEQDGWKALLLIAVWIFPAMLTHYFAQHLEFIFSQYQGIRGSTER